MEIFFYKKMLVLVFSRHTHSDMIMNLRAHKYLFFRTMVRTNTTKFLGFQHAQSLKSNFNIQTRSFAVDYRVGWGSKSQSSGIFKEFKKHPVLEIRRCLCKEEHCVHFFDKISFYAGHTDLSIRANLTHGNENASVLKKQDLQVLKTGKDLNYRNTALFIRRRENEYLTRPGDVIYNEAFKMQIEPYRQHLSRILGEKFASRLYLPLNPERIKILSLTRSKKIECLPPPSEKYLQITDNRNSIFISEKISILGDNFEMEFYILTIQ